MRNVTLVPCHSSCHQWGHQHLLRAWALTRGAGGVAEASQLTLLPVPLALQQLLHHVLAQQVLGQHQADVERGAMTDHTRVKGQGSSKDSMAAGAGVLMEWHSHRDRALPRMAQPQGWGTGGDSTAISTGHQQGQHSHEDRTPLRMAWPQGCSTGGDSTATGMRHWWGWHSHKDRALARTAQLQDQAGGATVWPSVGQDSGSRTGCSAHPGDSAQALQGQQEDQAPQLLQGGQAPAWGGPVGAGVNMALAGPCAPLPATYPSACSDSSSRPSSAAASAARQVSCRSPSRGSRLSGCMRATLSRPRNPTSRPRRSRSSPASSVPGRSRCRGESRGVRAGGRVPPRPVLGSLPLPGSAGRLGPGLPGGWPAGPAGCEAGGSRGPERPVSWHQAASPPASPCGSQSMAGHHRARGCSAQERMGL